MDLSYIKPPVASPNVVAVSTTATAATPVASTFVPGLYKFQADGDCWILFGGASVAAPVVSDTSSTGRCWKLPANQEKLFTIGADQSYFRVITDSSTSSTYLRWYLEQGR